MVLVVEDFDRWPQPGIGMVPPHPGRIGQRRRDGHVGEFGHQPGEHLGIAPGHGWRVSGQHLAAGPELLRVHGERTEIDGRGQRPGTRKTVLGQTGLGRDA